AENFQSITGKGAKATVNGTDYFIGNPRLFEEMISIPNDIKQQVQELQMQGRTVMLLGTQQEVKGLIAVADQVRKSSLSIIEKLKNIGIKKTIMLTGDNQAAGSAIGKQLGLSETKAELLPQDKLETIKSLQDKYGNVAM